jgi:CRP/FNR family cyclic AMP-dependent transcriptional regulator
MDADKQQEIDRFLSAGDWFGGMPAPLRQLIVSRSVIRKFARGQVISLEEGAPKGLFAVLEGSVHLVCALTGGEEAILHVGEPGFWFGEYAMLTGKLPIVTVVAHSPVRLLFLPKAQFDRTIDEDPRRYPFFARLILDRHAVLLRAFVHSRVPDPELRLRQRLVQLYELSKQDRPASAQAVLTLSQSELAKMVGVSRQTLNGMLGKLHRQGLIDVAFRRLRILDPKRLLGPVGEPSPESSRGAGKEQGASALPTPGRSTTAGR